MVTNNIVRPLERNEYKLWDKIVIESQHGTIFHESWWLCACSRLLNREFSIFGYFENEELLGGFSVFLSKYLFLKMASATVPTVPYGGLVIAQSRCGKGKEQEEKYLCIIEALIKSIKFDNIQLTNAPGLIDLRPFTWNRWDTGIMYTYYLNLADDPKDPNRNVRRMINKAVKSGIIVKKLQTPDSDHYALFKETYSRKNLKAPVAEPFFEAMIKLLLSKNREELWAAENPTGEYAASDIIIYDNKRAYRWLAASHTEFRKSGAVALLLSEILKDLGEKGVQEINLMTANNPTLSRFTSNFNPILVPYYTTGTRSHLFDLMSNMKKAFKEFAL